MKTRKFRTFAAIAVVIVIIGGFTACQNEPETPRNQPHSVNAGENQTVTLASDLTVTLNGSSSSDNVASYAWECASYTADQGQVYAPYSAAEVTALIFNADNATATVGLRKAGTYIFKFTVTDDADKTGTSNVTVIVRPSLPVAATVKITGRDFPSSGVSELNLGIEGYCSFEDDHEGFTEDDFEKIHFTFSSTSYYGELGSENRSTEDLDKYVVSGIIPASEYQNDAFPYITQTFYYDTQADNVGSRSFWTYQYSSRFYELYDGEPDWNVLSAFPVVSLTINKEETDLEPETASVTGITVVSPPAKTTYDVGDSLDFTGLVVKASYSNGTTQTVSIGDNHVRGFNNQAQETQSVTINFGGKTTTFNVSVSAVAVSSVSLNKVIMDLTVGDTEKLTTTIQPANAKNKAVSWHSNNTNIATVSEDGTVTAIALGATTIIVTTIDGGKTDECTVTVIPYTVIFNSNGGTNINSITVNPGNTITQPSNPSYDYGTFVGWYSDSDLTIPFLFSTPVNGNITIYAKWNLSFNIGDTGPGGGKIFYKSEAGFTMTDTGKNCHYLEAAPADMGSGLAWASEGYTTRQINTATAIGTGRNNTAIVLSIDANAPAAKACKEYENNGKTDWFLPSIDELAELYANRSLFTNLITTNGTRYWSSSSRTSNTATNYDFTYGFSNDYGFKEYINPVRAIRTF